MRKAAGALVLFTLVAGTAAYGHHSYSATYELANQGVTRESLKVGDEVIIIGRPSRVPGEYRALMVKLTRPSDGFTWGSPGQVVE